MVASYLATIASRLATIASCTATIATIVRVSFRRFAGHLAGGMPCVGATIVDKALQIDSIHRFASATEMLSAIRTLLPEGISIQGSMLVPLAEEVKTTLSAAARSVRGGGETVLNLTRGSAGARVVPSRRSVLGPVLALSLLLGGGGLATYKLRGSTAAVAPAVKVEATAAMPGAATSAPVVAPAPASAELSVRLAVEPADATVEIDCRGRDSRAPVSAA